MTAAELTAIQMLSQTVEQSITENRNQHNELREDLKGYHQRIVAIENHCRKQDAVTDEKIAAAITQAVTEARKPSVYRQATAGLVALIIRVSAVCVAVSAIFGFVAWALTSLHVI